MCVWRSWNASLYPAVCGPAALPASGERSSLGRALMECVITDASLRGAQQEEEQADAAEPGSTEGDPGGNTHTHTREYSTHFFFFL